MTAMTGSWSAAELPHRVSQKFVEATVRRHAQRWPGNDVRYGWVLEDSKDTDRGIEAKVRPTDGARSSVRQRLAIEWGGAIQFLIQ